MKLEELRRELWDAEANGDVLEGCVAALDRLIAVVQAAERLTQRIDFDDLNLALQDLRENDDET